MTVKRKLLKHYYIFLFLLTTIFEIENDLLLQFLSYHVTMISDNLLYKCIFHYNNNCVVQT